MPIRNTTDQMGAPAFSEVSGSQFDERKCPTLPPRLRGDVRAHAKRLLKHNVHLWDASQVHVIVRLATVYADVDAMSAEIDIDGFTVQTSKGDLKINPMIGLRDVMMRSALALERQLGITFAARNTGVKKAEQGRPAQPVVPQRLPDDPRPVARRLRLA